MGLSHSRHAPDKQWVALTLVVEDTTSEDLAMNVCAAWEEGRDYPESTPLKMMERPSLEHLREELTPEQFARLNDLLEEYDSLSMKHQYDFGFSNLIQHRIHLMPNVKPHKQTLCRSTPGKRH